MSLRKRGIMRKLLYLLVIFFREYERNNSKCYGSEWIISLTNSAQIISGCSVKQYVGTDRTEPADFLESIYSIRTTVLIRSNIYLN